jgi:adenosylcobalamin-dependent ribonucleoside-triphosphate reductase
MDITRGYGRLIDPKNNKDYRVAGVNPCAEQSLEDQELCTLVETYPIKHESLEDYLATIKVAYLYGKAVTMLPTHWPETNEVMTRNRRIGTSMSGIVQFAERYGWEQLRKWSDTAYAEINRRDQKYSEWLGVRESIKTTTIKPSGTVSLLAGVTPGVHWPVAADYYIRRQRFSKHDGAVPVFIDAGYHVEPDAVDDENTVVIEFPTIGPSVRSEKDVSVWEKVALAVLMQRHWADNAVSATFTIREDEHSEIEAVLRAFAGQLKSVSFLPI